eukprot:TRINITY_DN30934_c0_g1_i1.p1 TRINITY_DN30934_c0_g1~~TRINITY_DN30934_c0_g1_i1.p1  ORF type:complete len:434 (+),score=123.11 TRINITY_DN30934_c0_g1_i1:71-1372(+)
MPRLVGNNARATAQRQAEQKRTGRVSISSPPKQPKAAGVRKRPLQENSQPKLIEPLKVQKRLSGKGPRSQDVLRPACNDDVTDVVAAAAAAALKLYEELLRAFTLKKQKRGADGGWSNACEQAETMVARPEMQQSLLAAATSLLTSAGAAPAAAVETENGAYDVLELRGCNPFQDDDEKAESRTLEEQLACARSQGTQGLSRDALVAILAALASRREMCWLEAYDVETPARGYFAHALMDPASTLRVALSRPCLGSLTARPVSLLVTTLGPLEDALAAMDSGGPLANAPRGCQDHPEREYAFQEVEGEARQPLYTVAPDSDLTQLLRSREHVLAVETYAALAPRETSRQNGFNHIVRRELQLLLEEAKLRRRAVVFQLGGCDPHTLAEKVYLKPPFTLHGLRCGYLRWRPSPEASWAREPPAKDRACLGLQMP